MLICQSAVAPNGQAPLVGGAPQVDKHGKATTKPSGQCRSQPLLVAERDHANTLVASRISPAPLWLEVRPLIGLARPCTARPSIAARLRRIASSDGAWRLGSLGRNTSTTSPTVA